MKFKMLAAALALVANAPAMAACTNTFELGVMQDPSDTRALERLDQFEHLEDCFNFTLTETSNAHGFFFGQDVGAADIELFGVSLTGANLPQSIFDSSIWDFNFLNLLPGTYQLVLWGEGTINNPERLALMGYRGELMTSSVAVPVPEPSTYALMFAGLGALGLAARRRRQWNPPATLAH